MKLCILGDAHFGARNDSHVFHELYERFYTQTFFPYLREHGIKDIIQTGDIFDRRKYINYQTLDLCRKYFFDICKEDGIHLHILLGNHDVYYKNTLSLNSPTLLLSGYDNITIYDKPKTIKFDSLNIDIIPWVCDDTEAEILAFVKKTKSSHCVAHFELCGFEMDRGNVCFEGLDHKKLKRYEQVLSGHFHHRSEQDNILYVGSPTELTWADYDDPRGFHVLDTEERELRFIKNPHTIFRKIYYKDTEFDYGSVPDEEFDSYKGKYVKVIVLSKDNPLMFDMFIEKLTKADPADLSISEDFSEISIITDEDNVDQADDTVTIINKVIDNIEIPLNKDKLKNIINDIHTEAITVDL